MDVQGPKWPQPTPQFTPGLTPQVYSTPPATPPYYGFEPPKPQPSISTYAPQSGTNLLESLYNLATFNVPGGGAIPNVGNVSQPWRIPNTPWYSKLEKVVHERVPAQSSAEQVRGALKGGQVKQEEIDWSGVENYLQQNPQVNRDAFLQHVQQERPKVETAVYGGEQAANKRNEALQFEQQFQSNRDEIGRLDRAAQATDPRSKHVRRGLEDARTALEAENIQLTERIEILNSSPHNREPRWESYKQPGGENYSETLLKLPTKKLPPEEQITANYYSLKSPQGRLRSTGDEVAAARWLRDDPRVAGQITVTNTHKMNKSDWLHTEYRIADDEAMHYHKLMTEKYRPLDASTMEPRDFQDYRKVFQERDKKYHEWQTYRKSRLAEYNSEYRSPHWSEGNVLSHLRSSERTLPNGETALFLEENQSDWHQAGRDKGYKGGKAGAANAQEIATLQQSKLTLNDKRHALETEFIQKFGSSPALSGLDLVGKNSDVARSNILNAFGQGYVNHELLVERGMTPDAINQMKALGKEWIAARDAGIAGIGRIDKLKRANEYGVQDAPFKKTWPMLGMKQALHDAAAKNKDWLTWTTGEGIAGKVGGELEGQQGFYDDILVKEMNAYVKKYGARVEPVVLLGGEVMHGGVSGQDVLSAAGVPEAEIASRWRAMPQFRRDEMMNEFRSKWGNQRPMQAWGVRLTPQMKYALTHEGQPLFSIGNVATGGGTAGALSDALTKQRSDTTESKETRSNLQRLHP